MKSRVCKLEDLRQGIPVSFDVNGEAILVVLRGSEVHAVSDKCTHQGASLCKGRIQGFFVQCQLHGARFDLRTGDAMSPPAVSSLSRFEVTVEDGEVWLEEE